MAFRPGSPPCDCEVEAWRRLGHGDPAGVFPNVRQLAGIATNPTSIRFSAVPALACKFRFRCKTEGGWERSRAAGTVYLMSGEVPPRLGSTVSPASGRWGASLVTFRTMAVR